MNIITIVAIIGILISLGSFFYTENKEAKGWIVSLIVWQIGVVILSLNYS